MLLQDTVKPVSRGEEEAGSHLMAKYVKRYCAKHQRAQASATGATGSSNSMFLVK